MLVARHDDGDDDIIKRTRFKEFKINTSQNTTEKRTHWQTKFLFIKSVVVLEITT